MQNEEPKVGQGEQYQDFWYRSRNVATRPLLSEDSSKRNFYCLSPEISNQIHRSISRSKKLYILSTGLMPIDLVTCSDKQKQNPKYQPNFFRNLNLWDCSKCCYQLQTQELGVQRVGGGSSHAESLDSGIAYTKRAALEFLSHNSAQERPWTRN